MSFCVRIIYIPYEKTKFAAWIHVLAAGTGSCSCWRKAAFYDKKLWGI
jgi:hypothetical protein